MARSKSRSGSSRRGSAASAEVAEVEVVSEESGMGFEAGLAIITAVILFAAVLLVDYDRGANYGEGMLFKGKYAENAASATE